MGINSREVRRYVKKECVCIDGWVKEGGECLMFLEGLRRDGHMHANLRNFVIPIEDGEG